MGIPRIIIFLALGLASLLLVSCLHKPTKSTDIDSLSKNLHIYQSGDQISYNVEAHAFLVEKDPSDANMILIAVQETDGPGKLKYLAVDGAVVILDNTGTEPVYTDESGAALDQKYIDDFIPGIVPLLNCSYIENIIGEPCIEELYLVGTMSVLWVVPGTPLIEPVSGIEQTLMKESWNLSLTLADEKYVVVGTAPLMTSTIVRYISQATEGNNKGELFVHAYDTSVADTYDWVSVVNEQLDLISEFVVAKAVSDPSPINGSNETANIVSYVNQNCDNATDIGSCLQVASSEKILTYQLNSEKRVIGTLGTFTTQVLSFSGKVSRTTTATGAVNLGYDIFSSCDEDIPGVTFERTDVTYNGNMAIFQDIGAIQFDYTCSANYSVTYTVNSATKTQRVGTSIRFDAEMASTNISY